MALDQLTSLKGHFKRQLQDSGGVRSSDLAKSAVRYGCAGGWPEFCVVENVECLGTEDELCVLANQVRGLLEGQIEIGVPRTVE